MSQVDRLHFFSSLVWVIFFFIVWYIFIISFFFPLYYRNMRGRFLVESRLWYDFKTNQYLIRLLTNFFDILSMLSLRRLLIFNIVWRFRTYNLHKSFLKNDMVDVKAIENMLISDYNRDWSNFESLRKSNYKSWSSQFSKLLYKKFSNK